MGEGAGMLILENYDVAVERGAHIYAEVRGFGLTADASHITAPVEDGSGASRAMQMAIDRAGLVAEDVVYINAHGTSTLPNDRVETVAIKATFGEAASRLKISATKSQLGHLLGAAGGVEAIATVLTMEHGFIPATLNYENPDPECDLDYTPISVEMPVPVALSNSFGFGGQNATLIFVRECSERDPAGRGLELP
jgi:3-oxoacyl-[acyl-carrier-protein] synthase II